MSKHKKISRLGGAGVGLVEIVVGAAILSALLFTVSTFLSKSLYASREMSNTVKASFLLEEGLEVARFFRDESWQNITGLTPSVDYYLLFSGSSWATTTTVTTDDNIFYRTFVVEDVYRDFSGVIVPGGSIDPNTRKVTSSVSWNSGLSTTTIVISTYLTNLFAN